MDLLWVLSWSALSMFRIEKWLACALLIGSVNLAGSTKAQWVGPINPYDPPPATYRPYGPNFPSPYYDPNAVVGGSSRSNSYWDPYRGWVTHDQTTTVLNSATSPGRRPMPGTRIQYYNYWNGSGWVRGSRWLGRDGLWHGDHQDTRVSPNGSTSDRVIFYAPNPKADDQGSSPAGDGIPAQEDEGRPHRPGTFKTR